MVPTKTFSPITFLTSLLSPVRELSSKEAWSLIMETRVPSAGGVAPTWTRTTSPTSRRSAEIRDKENPSVSRSDGERVGASFSASRDAECVRLGEKDLDIVLYEGAWTRRAVEGRSFPKAVIASAV